MASIIYNKYFENVFRATVDADSATYKVLLTTSAYVEAKKTHGFRSDVTNEVAAGNGYTAGGATATVTVTLDNTNDRLDIALGGATWTTAAGQTLTARKAVYYVSTGGAATADTLVAVVDFGTDQIASNGGPLTLAASTLRVAL